MTGILVAAAIVGGVGLFIGVFLGISGKKFAVEVDEREEEITGVLPGNNCGGCGYAGCSGLAAAIVKGEAPVNACPVGGAPVAEKVAAIMGQEAGETVRMTAFVKCAGTCEKAKDNYKYTGTHDCVMVNMMQNNGPKGCVFGCLGEGTCVAACPFDAIHIKDGIMSVCSVGCIGCKMCERVCEFDAVKVTNNVAHIDPSKCTNCGQCAEKCPKKIIA